jgi:hypothetical protein
MNALTHSNKDKRIAAIQALGSCGANAESALPLLHKIIKRANAPKEDYLRAYMTTSSMPEHVHAKIAIRRIEKGQ